MSSRAPQGSPRTDRPRQAPRLDEHVFIFSSTNTHRNCPDLTWTHHLNRCSFQLPFLPHGQTRVPSARLCEAVRGHLSFIFQSSRRIIAVRKRRQSCRAALLRRLLHSWSGSSPSGEGPDSSLRFVFSFSCFSFGLGSRGMRLDGRRYVWCCGAVSPASELLARRSPAKPPVLWRGGGQAEQEGSCLFWRDVGKVN